MSRYRIVIDGRPVTVITRAWLNRYIFDLGLTLGQTIRIRSDSASVTAYLLGHEYRHTVQWQERGVVGFLTTYVAELIANRGYSTEKPGLENDAYLYGLEHAAIFQPIAEQIIAGGGPLAVRLPRDWRPLEWAVVIAAVAGLCMVTRC